MSGQMPLAQAERLECLIEELSEAIQIACKTLRHGYYSNSPVGPDYRMNRMLLEEELGHVLSRARDMIAKADINGLAIEASAQTKSETAPRWQHHQE